jgi:hypothetical protein
MYDNALKCIEKDYPLLLGLAQKLGAISIIDGKVVPAEGVVWDYIGHKLYGDAPAEGKKDTRVILADAKGNKYVHINVRTPFSVGGAAAVLAGGDPEIAGALADAKRLFVTHEDGSVKDPDQPVRVFL